MPGLFGNLVQASKALAAHQQAIQVTGRNLANINNPEYARQRVVIADRYVTQTPHGPEGTGVEVLAVQQLRDTFLDRQVVRQASDNGFLQAQYDALSNAELVLGDRIDRASDPASLGDVANSPTGIGAALDQFFNSMGVLAATPSDVPARTVALESARLLQDRINVANENLEVLEGDLEDQIDGNLSEANELLNDIANLNFLIRQADSVMSGGGADLIDKRQAKLERLARLVKIDVTPEAGSPLELRVKISGKDAVVYGMKQGDLSYDPSSGIQWTDGSKVAATIALTGGEAQGRFAALHGGGVAALGVRLGAMANAIRVAVNDIYNPSRSGTDFFQAGTGSSLIVLNPVISATSLVTGPSGNAGDNAYVKSIGNLRTTVSTVSIGKGGSLLLSSDSVVKMLDVTGLTAGMKVWGAGTSNSVHSGWSGASAAVLTMASTAGWLPGMLVSGAGIPAGTRIVSVGSSPTQVTLSNPVTVSANASIVAGTTVKSVNASAVPPTVTLSHPSGISSPVSGNTLTFEANEKLLDFARGMVTDIAVSAQAASSRLEEATVLETALRTQRDSVSAVSLDEETTDLLRFQKAYQANAKVISVIDEMLQSLIAMVR
jgi:flagellar hook-associated protein 1 FlgK